jgi:hypothetical protein
MVCVDRQGKLVETGWVKALNAGHFVITSTIAAMGPAKTL